MSIILAFLGSSIGKYVLGAGFALIAAVGLAFQQRLAGARAERAKQAAANLRAAQDLHEMDREATAAEQTAAGMTDEQSRAEASKWVKH